MIDYDLESVTTIRDSAETAISVGEVKPNPTVQRSNYTNQISSLDGTISRVREAADRAKDCPYSKDKEAAAEAAGTDTRGWGIGRFIWNITNGPFAREVAENMSAIEQKISAVKTWLNDSDLSNLYDGPKILIDTSVELGNARDATENAASHLADTNYNATALDVWSIAGMTPYKSHRGNQGKAIMQFSDYCKAGSTQLGNYAMAVHVAYSAVSNLLAHLAIQIAQFAQSLIDSLISRKFKEAALDTIEFIGKVLEAMQKILDQATNLYREQLTAARDLRENTISSTFPGQKWPARPPFN